jgi:hypothetical protein
MARGVSGDAIEKLYDIICRNEDTGLGGITPTDTSFHSSYFKRYFDGEPIDDASDGDRLVFISYTGHVEDNSLAHPSKDHWTFGMVVQIRYHTGDHDAHSQVVMADDFHLIAKTAMAESQKPTGVYGYYFRGSTVTPVDEESYIMAIEVEAQVHGAS